MGEQETRREFLRRSGAVAAGVGVGLPLLSACGGQGEAHAGVFRWAMVVDTAACEAARERDGGCAACTDACHRVHNVPRVVTPDGEPDPKEEVKWIWKETFEHAFPMQESHYMKEGLRDRPTLVFCNQCDSPPCVRVCPTQATFRREDGIVMMDMHRCIGCRYCIVGCPYGSRSFNWSDPREILAAEEGRKVNPDYPTRAKGVVEKCNGCAELDLANGELPACVAACPHGALTFGDLNREDSPVRKLLSSRYTIRRKPGLGTDPHIFYVV